jgi:hypothetical protein
VESTTKGLEQMEEKTLGIKDKAEEFLHSDSNKDKYSNSRKHWSHVGEATPTQGVG